MTSDNPKVIIETQQQLREYIFTHCTLYADVRILVEDWRSNREYLII